MCWAKREERKRAREWARECVSPCERARMSVCAYARESEREFLSVSEGEMGGGSERGDNILLSFKMKIF